MKPRSIYLMLKGDAATVSFLKMHVKVMAISAVRNLVLEHVCCNVPRRLCGANQASKYVNLIQSPSSRKILLTRTVMHAGSHEINVGEAYSSPRVYDIAFSFRDFEAEAAFLLQAHQEFCNQRLSCFLDVGCGPARHAILLAEAGVAKCLGVDISQEMISYAKSCAINRNVQSKVHLIQGDMTSDIEYYALFGVKKGEVDLAAIMLGTFSHCLTNNAAIQTLTNISRCELFLNVSLYVNLSS